MSSNRAALALIREGYAALLAADPPGLALEQLREEQRELEAIRGLHDVAAAARLAAFEAQGGPEAECASSTRAWLRREFRLDAGEAKRRVDAARVLRDLPDTAAALAAGRIHGGHVRVLADAGHTIGADVLADAEPVLLDLAKAATPHDVRVAVDRLALAVAAGEEREAAEQRRHEGRYVRLTPGFAGGFDLVGSLDEADGRAVQALFTAYARRRKRTDPNAPADTRTLVQRQADVLVEAAKRMLDTGDEAVVGRLPVAVTLVTDLETLRGERKRWAPGSLLSSVFRHGFGQAALERLTCTADITPALVTTTGVPLALGRTSRCATAHQMKMLSLRDGGCVMPGCDNSRVEAHHLIWWARGGLTDVDNMALVCSRCHTLLHEYGWALEHDPRRPGLLRWRLPDGRPPIPARHTLDRDPGSKLPFD